MADFPAWGIHVTASSVRAVKIEKDDRGLRVVAHDQVDFTEDIDDINSLERHGALAHALATFAKRHELEKCRVIVSVDASTAFNRSVTTPLVQGESLRRILSYEAQQQIPFDLETVYWDHKVLDVRQDDGEADVILFATKKEVVEERHRRLVKLRFPVDGFQLGPVALYNFAVQEHLAKDGYVLVSADFDRVDIVVCHGKRFWFRSLPTGIHTMFEEMVDTLGGKHRHMVHVVRDGVRTENREAIDKLRARAAERLATEIGRTIAYYNGALQNVVLKGILLLPGSVAVPPMSKRLKSMTGLDVYAVKTFRHLEIDPTIVTPEISKSVAGLAHAAGLALQGVGECNVDIKLYDPAIERVITGRRVFYVLSMLTIFVVVGLMWMKTSEHLDGVEAERQELVDLGGSMEAANQEFRQSREERTLKEKIVPLRDAGRHRLAPVHAVDALLQALHRANEGRDDGSRTYLVKMDTHSGDLGKGSTAAKRRVELILGRVEADGEKAMRREVETGVLAELKKDARVDGIELGETFIAADLTVTASPDVETRVLRRKFRMIQAAFEYDESKADGAGDQP